MAKIERKFYTNDYSEFLDWNKDEDIKEWMEEDGFSGTEEEFIYDQMDRDWGDLVCNLSFSKYNTPCVVCGTLGLWDGLHTICPCKFDNLVDALQKCCGEGYVTIKQIDSHIEVVQSHHDGTNNFCIYVLNEEGLNADEVDLSEDRYHVSDIEYFF